MRRIARQVGKRIGEELAIPVYLYEHAASTPERRNLADVRAGEYEGLEKKLANPDWKPDFGPAVFNRKSGATAVGAREFLIAYNINLNTTDRRYANEIAYEVRERGRWKRAGNVKPFYYKGEVFTSRKVNTRTAIRISWPAPSRSWRITTRKTTAAICRTLSSIGLDPDNLVGCPVYKDGMFTHLKGIGWVVDDYQCAQVSLNLTNYKVTPPDEVLEAARELAVQRGIVVTGSEVVGVVPFDAMQQAGRFYLQRMQKSTGIPARDIVITAVQAMGLNDVAEFDIDKKVIGLPVANGPLANLKVDGFRRRGVARHAGARWRLDRRAGRRAGLCAGLDGRQPVHRQGRIRCAVRRLCDWRRNAQAIKDELVRAIDADTEAFNEVIAGLRMPKDTPEQIEVRSKVIRAGYKSAAKVPLRTAQLCREVLDLCQQAADIGNQAVMSDAGVGALMAWPACRARSTTCASTCPIPRTRRSFPG